MFFQAGLCRLGRRAAAVQSQQEPGWPKLIALRSLSQNGRLPQSCRIALRLIPRMLETQTSHLVGVMPQRSSWT